MWKIQLIKAVWFAVSSIYHMLKFHVALIWIVIVLNIGSFHFMIQLFYKIQDALMMMHDKPRRDAKYKTLWNWHSISPLNRMVCSQNYSPVLQKSETFKNNSLNLFLLKLESCSVVQVCIGLTNVFQMMTLWKFIGVNSIALCRKIPLWSW